MFFAQTLRKKLESEYKESLFDRNWKINIQFLFKN